ncbi:cell division cycle protein [Histomonas meleagridis]|uniref:cell division cycle protein 16-like n=1 Tax=Histomonas meleagridis TaxID=135588 RepID=UPI00355A7B86|nr:cell division cycle protein [Histomonas meleagridis]KAH0798333.1 cell division cycle protein 16-like [Histomonas meleagridis]
MENIPKFALNFLSKLEDENLNTQDPVDFCQKLFIRKQYHRIISYVDSLSDPRSLPANFQFWFLTSLCKVYKYKDCQIYIDSLCTSLQEDPKIIYIKGVCYLRQQNYQASISCFTDSFLKDPFFLPPLKKLLSHYLISESTFNDLISKIKAPQNHINSLKEYASLSWFYNQEEKTAFDRISELYAKHPTSPRVITAYVSCCLRSNKRSDLYVIAQRLFDKNHEALLSIFAMSCHMILIERSEAARSLLLKCIRLSPSFAPAWVCYAATHWMDGDPRTALNVILIAAHAFPEMELLYMWAGRLYSECGENAMAIAHFNRCKKTGYVLHEIGCILLKQGKYKEAAEILERALQCDDCCTEYVINCATAQRRNGNLERAMELLVDIEDKEPDNVDAVLNLGFTLHLMLLYDEAIEKYIKVLKIRPDNAFAATMMEDAMQKVIQNPVLSYVSVEPLQNFDDMFENWKQNNK